MRAAHAANNEDTGEGERDDQDDDRHGHQPRSPPVTPGFFDAECARAGAGGTAGTGCAGGGVGAGGRCIPRASMLMRRTSSTVGIMRFFLPGACGQWRRPACYHPYLLTNYKLTGFTNRCAHSRRVNPLRCVGIFVLILPPAMRICVQSFTMSTHGGTMCASNR